MTNDPSSVAIALAAALRRELSIVLSQNLGKWILRRVDEIRKKSETRMTKEKRQVGPARHSTFGFRASLGRV